MYLINGRFQLSNGKNKNGTVKIVLQGMSIIQSWKVKRLINRVIRGRPTSLQMQGA